MPNATIPSRFLGFLKPLTSLRLTVACFGSAMVLIFFGTLEQAHLGIYGVQEKYFQSLVVMVAVPGTSITLPMFPGGYFLGALTLLNLVAAQVIRFRWSWGKSGIYFLHLGVILLLLGLLFTDLFSDESEMRLAEGQTQNYSTSLREKEFALLDISDHEVDRVVVIPDGRLRPGASIEHPALPFTLHVLTFFPNSTLVPVDSSAAAPMSRIVLNRDTAVAPKPRATKPEESDTASLEVTLRYPDGQEETRVFSEGLPGGESLVVAGKTWRLSLRARRIYKPYALTLHDFEHKTYPGTEIPKDFSSQVSIANPSTGEERDTRISMNNPLRYAGSTFYQLAYTDNSTSILQVVENPGWWFPYIACGLVGLGMVMQFSAHLLRFTRRSP